MISKFLIRTAGIMIALHLLSYFTLYNLIAAQQHLVLFTCIRFYSNITACNFMSYKLHALLYFSKNSVHHKISDTNKFHKDRMSQLCKKRCCTISRITGGYVLSVSLQSYTVGLQ